MKLKRRAERTKPVRQPTMYGGPLRNRKALRFIALSQPQLRRRSSERLVGPRRSAQQGSWYDHERGLVSAGISYNAVQFETGGQWKCCASGIEGGSSGDVLPRRRGCVQEVEQSRQE